MKLKIGKQCGKCGWHNPHEAMLWFAPLGAPLAFLYVDGGTRGGKCMDHTGFSGGRFV